MYEHIENQSYVFNTNVVWEPPTQHPDMNEWSQHICKISVPIFPIEYLKLIVLGFI